jgi:hypothetical protein
VLGEYSWCQALETFWCSHDASAPVRNGMGAKSCSGLEARVFGLGWGQRRLSYLYGIELKSLILAQIERWRHALHMQVERQRGGNPGGERRTGE